MSNLIENVIGMSVCAIILIGFVIAFRIKTR